MNKENAKEIEKIIELLKNDKATPEVCGMAVHYVIVGEGDNISQNEIDSIEKRLNALQSSMYQEEVK